MPLTIPTELKRITQFIRRAEELDKDHTKPESRLVAYHCRQHAVQTGLSLEQSSTPAAQACLGDILNTLEEEKAPMSVFSPSEARTVCRQFASSIFEKADAQDRAGNSNKNTARTFYAAAVFYEMLGQFDAELSGEGEEAEEQHKRKYSKWKATEILKAMKEGREPTPGGYEEPVVPVEIDVVDDNVAGETIVSNVSTESESVEVVHEPPAAPSAPPAAPSAAPSGFGGLPPPIAPPPPLPAPTPTPAPISALMPTTALTPTPAPRRPASPKTNSFGGFKFGGSKKTNKPTKDAMQDATELTRFALAALKSNDADLAADRLEKALAVLGRR